MFERFRDLSLALLATLVTASALASAPPPYRPIVPATDPGTVTLTGRDLTIEEIVRVARGGARVEVTAAARQHEADNFGLLLEAAAEGIPVYWFNRGTAEQRETVIFEGDALAPANTALIEEMQLASFRRGAVAGIAPEVLDEDVVRAMMVVRANTMVHNAPSPALADMLLELLNRRITPVVRSRGTVGEGDLAPLGNVGGTMIGAGQAYYRGVRMSAARALHEAGLKPLRPFGADDNALTSSNAYATGQAALLVHDAERALEWADLSYAMALEGMNSSVTPLSLVVQRDRPDAWLNWHAAHTLAMLRGSYLFEADRARIIQDPESLRASSIRQASAWKAWAALKDAVLFQANSSDHNPAVAIDASPSDSWELASPQLMRYFVKGGPLSQGRHGYIVSNANWDPYPLANLLEGFTLALANMDVAVMLRIERFRNPLFTVVAAAEVLPGFAHADDDYYAPVDLMQEIAALANPVAPLGSALFADVEDLEGQTRLKLAHAHQAVETTVELLAYDLLEAALWIDVRRAQDPRRAFGTAPSAAWSSLRRALPLRLAGEAAADPPHSVATAFLRATPATTFAPADATRPDLSATRP